MSDEVTIVVCRRGRKPGPSQQVSIPARSIVLPDSETQLAWCPKCGCPVAHRKGHVTLALEQHDARVHQGR